MDYFLFAKENSFLAEYKGITFANNFSNQISGEEAKETEEESEDVQSEDNMTASNMNFKPNYSKQEIDLDNAYKTPKGEEIIDSIIAMTIYWVLSFDWQILGEFMKDYVREDPSKKKIDLTSVLIKQLGKYSNPTKMSILLIIINIEILLLSYIFNEKKGRKINCFGPITSSALLCLTLNIPFRAQSKEELRKTQLNNLVKNGGKSKEKLIKQPIILEYLLKHLNVFSPEGKKQFLKDFDIIITDKRLMQELAENNNLIDLSFLLLEYGNSPNLQNLLQELLLFLLSQNGHLPDFVRGCGKICGPPTNKLNIVDKILEKVMSVPAIMDVRQSTALVYCSYLLEDAISMDPEILRLPFTIEVLCRLLFSLNKTDLLYISLPSMAIFDERGTYENTMANSTFICIIIYLKNR